jgi:DNA mismatch repair protein MutS
LPLFAGAVPVAEPVPSAVEERLRALKPDELSPREALELVYELRRMVGEASCSAEGQLP